MNFLKLLAIFFIISLSACKQANKEQEQQLFKASFANPIVRQVVDYDEYIGRFVASNRVELKARVNGYLDAIRFKDGDYVTKGTPLFVIDERPFAIELARAQSEFNLAKHNLERARNLKETRAIAQEELDTREQEFAMSEAVLDKAKLDLEYSVVKAPISGNISRRLVDPGNLISSDNTLLTTIVNDSPIYFYFETSINDFLKYSKLSNSDTNFLLQNASTNTALVKLLDETEYNIPATIDFVDNEIDNNTGTMQMRAVINNDSHALKPGVFGKIKVQASNEYKAILIPQEIIGTDQSYKFVYVINDKNMIELKHITLGKLQPDNFRVVVSGLSETDKVINKDIQIVRPFMPVEPTKGVF